MKIKVIIFMFTVLTVSTALTGLFLFYYSTKTAALKEDRTISESHTKVIKNNIFQIISRYHGIARSLSRHSELTPALTDISGATLNRVNQILDLYNSSMQTGVCYILNRKGVVIASSNRNDTDSFVGKNYSFRPYFTNSIKGSPFAYMAVGVTSNKRGIYFSCPIYAPDSSMIIGVSVIKEDVDKIENESLAVHYPTHVEHRDFLFIANEDGVIFISGQKKLLLHTVWQINEDKIKNISASMQFGKGPWPWAGFKRIDQEKAMDQSGRNYSLFSETLKALPNWRIIHISDSDAALDRIHKSFFKTFGYVFLLVFIIIGSVLFVLHYLADKAEKDLRNSEERYRSVTEAVNEGIILRSASGEILTWNKGAEKIYGISARDVIGPISKGENRTGIHKNHSLFDAENHPSTRTLRTGELFRNEIMSIYQPSGDLRWISVNTNPLFRNHNEKPYAVAISFSDITERKQAEERLRESETRLRTIFDISQAGIILVDPQGIITYANQGMAKMFGCTVQQVIGSSYPEHVHPDQRDIGDQRMRQLITGEIDSVSFERHYIRLDGTDFWGFLTGRRHEDEHGKLISLVGTIADITERKSLENELRQAYKMESLGTLTGGVAHDFNNILNVILGNSELALADVPESSPVHANLEEIRTAGFRAADIVKQLLSFSRQSNQEFKPIELSSIMDDSLKLLRSLIPSNIEIKKVFEAEKETILADPVQINQVVMNLCMNASQEMEKDGGRLEIVLDNFNLDQNIIKDYTDLPPGDYLRLRFIDTGSGIDPKFIDRIFDPYFTTKDIGKGSGIGLAVVHGIVKNHNGAISVDSEPGKGTTFKILFPIIERKKSDSAPEKVESIPHGKETILFVDDDDSIADITKKTLERIGYQVEICLDSIDALELFKSNPNHFDLVITDMTMPRMTGDKLAKMMIAIRSDIPVIISTGYSSLIDEDKAKKNGIADFIMKPVSMSAIAQTIRKVLDKKQAVD